MTSNKIRNFLLALSSLVILSGCQVQYKDTPPKPIVNTDSARKNGEAEMSNFIYGFRGQMWGVKDKEQVTNMIRNANVDWFGQQVRWEDIEIRKGNYDWSELDAIVKTCQESGLKLILHVLGAPEWTRKDPKYSYPNNPEDFGSFMRTLASRYGGRVDGYELLNEANIADEVGPGNFDPCLFSRLLMTGHEAVKYADPLAFTISGALTPTGVMDERGQDDAYYLDALYRCLNGKLPTDYLGAHANMANNPPEDTPEKNTTAINLEGYTTSYKGHPSFYLIRLLQLHDIMEKYGDADKLIFVTEGGWASSINPHPRYIFATDNTEEEQAVYLTRALGIMKGWPVAGWMIWNLNYGKFTDPLDSFGLYAYSVLDADGNPRPAYYRIQDTLK